MLYVLAAVVTAISLAVAALFLSLGDGIKSFLKKTAENVYEVTSIPSTFIVFGTIIKKSMGKPSRQLSLPKTCLELKSVSVDGDKVSAYSKLQMMMMLDDKFPFPALGLVHLANRIQQFADVKVGMEVNASVKCVNLRRHQKGYCFDVTCDIFATNKPTEAVWRSTSTYLCRKKHKDGDGCEGEFVSELSEADMAGLDQTESWKLPGDMGRQYAEVSGDYNPIHMYAFTAKLFGFSKGCIIHGMWTAARALGSLDAVFDAASLSSNANKQPCMTLYVEFKTPMFLPKTFQFAQAAGAKEDKKRKFHVVGGKDNTMPHMRGYLSK